MPKIAKAPRRGTRYGPFLSVDRLVGLKSAGTKDIVKVQFLPQWEDYENDVEAVLSKRFVMVDMGMTELSRQDLEGMERVTEGLTRAIKSEPEKVLEIANAFGPSGTRERREGAIDQAAALGLANRDDDGPVAIWGPLIAIGAALLLSACCKETDSDCGSNGTDTDDDKGAGGSTGGGTGGSTGSGTG